MKNINKIICIFFTFFLPLGLITINAQTDTLITPKLYKPNKPVQNDSIPVKDSLAEKHRQDSIEFRMQFVRDSILEREKFIRDSIIRRQVIKDSVTFLKNELDGILEPYFRTIEEDIILNCKKISIVGDSVLGDFTGVVLPFGISGPYTPWKIVSPLSGESVKIVTDKDKKMISINTPRIKASFVRNKNILIIQELPSIRKGSTGNFYKIPIDSVFFEGNNRIVKIKRYEQYYSLLNNNQRGAPLSIHLKQIKQFEYGQGNEINHFQVIRFCEQSNTQTGNKVCSIQDYSLNKQEGTYFLTRKNNPSNYFSDGTFKYIFGDNENLKSISFSNTAKTENWERVIEVNDKGYVSCYFDKKAGVIIQSLCMIYHTDPKAKYSVETITTTFEKDGISYYQKNNSTGLIRTRDKLTLEWGPWR